MSQPLRVVHVIQNLNYGGMEKLLADLVVHMDRTRFESHVLALGYLGRYSKDMEGHAGLHLGPRMSPFSMLRPAGLARCLRGLRPDLVHTHGGVWYKTSRAAGMIGRPLVHTAHGLPAGDRLSRLLERSAARRTRTLVAVSEALGAHLVEHLAVAPDVIRVIRNGVNLDRFRPRTPSGRLRRELGLAPDQPIVGSIGRLEPIKGYDVVLRAFARVRRPDGQGQPVLVVAGEGSAHAALEALSRSLGIADRVHLLGWRDDSEDLYAHFRCFVMGSWSEGTSVSLLEAMASGLAPVVTAVGGNEAVLGSRLAGQAVPAGEVEALAEEIQRVLLPERSAAIGAEARAQVEREFNLAVTVRNYEALYEGTRAMATDGRRP